MLRVLEIEMNIEIAADSNWSCGECRSSGISRCGVRYSS